MDQIRRFYTPIQFFYFFFRFLLENAFEDIFFN